MMEEAEIQRMSLPERLQAMEQLWDALRHDVEEVHSPAWRGAVVAERKARAQRGEARFLTRDQLRARLRGAAS